MKPKRILAVHDLSGFGHTSLLAAIPIMYRMGIETAVLPTVLLSANTDYPDYCSLDTTGFMEETLKHWRWLELKFDAVYTGFLGSEEQVDLLKVHLPHLLKAQSPILVDPVLGDKGELYGCYLSSMIDAMRSLVAISNIITPNWTEANFLLGESYLDTYPEGNLRGKCEKLSTLGAAKVIITSAPGKDGANSLVACYDRDQASYQEIQCSYLPVDFPGAGDCFASLFLAALLSGYPYSTAVAGSIRFMHSSFAQSQSTVQDRRSGISLAAALTADPKIWFGN